MPEVVHTARTTLNKLQRDTLIAAASAERPASIHALIHESIGSRRRPDIAEMVECGLLDSEQRGRRILYAATPRGKRVAGLLLEIEKELTC